MTPPNTDQGLPDLATDVPAIRSFVTKQEMAAAILRDAIVSGKLAPGQRLRQGQVSQQMGLSWTPVREAFRLLEAEGWLVIEHHRGVVVAPLSLPDFEDIYMLRLVNEPIAARLSTEAADASVVHTLQGHFDRLHRLDFHQQKDVGTYLQVEREFHRTHYLAGGNRRLFEIVMGLRDVSERYLRASLNHLPDEFAHHRQVHQDLLAACRKRDGAAAAVTMETALKRVLTRTRPILAEMFASGDALAEADQEGGRT